MINKLWLKRKRWDLPLIILALSVLMQLALWARMNLKYFYVTDYDASMLFYHVMSMWKEKALLIPDWVYMTTGEWDCASVLALPVYGLTGNFKLAFGLANTCNVALFALVVSRLFQGISAQHGRSKGMLLAIGLILMPYCWGQLDYANMLFYSGAQYIYKVLLPLWLISLYVGMPKKSVPAVLYSVAFYLLVFATASSSGLYVMICGLFPVLCCAMIRMVASVEKADKRAFLISVLTAIVFVGGFVFQKAANLATRADAMKLLPMEAVFPNVLKVLKDFTYVIEALPQWTSLEIFAPEALMSYFKIGILVVMVAMGVGELSRCFMLKTAFAESERIDDSESFVKASLASVFVWNLFILTLTESTPRYHLIGFIPFMILAGISLSEKLEACTLIRLKRLLWTGVAAMVLLLAVILFADARNQVTDVNEQYSELIIAEAQTQDVDTIILLDDGWTAERTRPLDFDRTYLAYSTSLEKMINFDVPASFNDMSHFDERHMLVTQRLYPFDRLPESMQERYTLVRDEWGVQFYMAEAID